MVNYHVVGVSHIDMAFEFILPFDCSNSFPATRREWADRRDQEI